MRQDFRKTYAPTYVQAYESHPHGRSGGFTDRINGIFGA